MGRRVKAQNLRFQFHKRGQLFIRRSFPGRHHEIKLTANS
jgi:hypothetical protein